MPPPARPLEIAGAAARLNRGFLDALRRFARAAGPAIEQLQRRFQAGLGRRGMGEREAAAIAAVTPGALAAHLQQGRDGAALMEEIQYRGRRLAKLGLLPAEVSAALRCYDRLLGRWLRRLETRRPGRFDGPLGQLSFLVLLNLNEAYFRVREAESRAFFDLFRAEAEGGPESVLLERFLSVLAEYAGAREARVFLRDGPPDGQRAPWVAGRLGEAVCFNPAASDHPLMEPAWRRWCRTCWSIPLRPGGALRGVIQLGFPKEYEWLPRERELMLAASEMCSQAYERARLLDDLARGREQIRQLAAHMIEVEEAERRRISRELHDEAGQSLLCMRLQLEMIEQGLPPGAAAIRHRLAGVRELAENTIVEIRRLIAALSPSILERLGLASALRQLGAQFLRLYPCRFKLKIPPRLELPRNVEIVVYRLAQEILSNTAKYSSASNVNLSFEVADGILRMHAEDDGAGFDYESACAKQDCYGLAGLRERVALLGGNMQLDSVVRKPGRARRRKGGQSAGGTRIRIELPLAGA
jgi:signal transduction histidine kinase